MTNNEAIKILENYQNGYFGYKIDDVHEAHNLAIKALKNERHKASWVYVQYDANPEIGNWHCSNCRCMPWYSGDIHTLKYCPECGYDMRGDNNEKSGN